METSRTLLDIFSKVSDLLSERERKIFSDSSDAVIVKRDPANRIIETRFRLPYTVDKGELYALEEKLRNAYSLFVARLLPSYPREAFSTDYMRQVFRELSYIGVISDGFLSEFSACEEGGTVKVRIPFGTKGLAFLDKSAGFAEKIIMSEFGLERKVVFEESADSAEYNRKYDEMQNSLDRELNKGFIEAQRQREEDMKRAAERKTDEAQGEEKPVLPHVSSLVSDVTRTPEREGNVYRSGLMEFDVSEPEQVAGEMFEIGNVTPISAIEQNMRNVTVLCRVFKVDGKATRRGDRMMFNIAVTDNESSVFIKDSAEMKGDVEPECIFKPGSCYAVQGYVRTDEFDRDPYIKYRNVMKIKSLERRDESPEKRVELHLHTNMSQTDALTKADDIVKTACKWGHRAVAITDHGNLQSYPVAMLAADELREKALSKLLGSFGNPPAKIKLEKFELMTEEKLFGYIEKCREGEKDDEAVAVYELFRREVPAEQVLSAASLPREQAESIKKLAEDEFKVIYGIEAYYVDDTARAAFLGSSDVSFDDEFAVFDIETTGLSALSNRITELGCVIWKNGEVKDTFNTLVNPEIPIPEEIVKVTGITDEMVKDAPLISEALPEFMKFVGDRMLVAHNASFDTGFIRKACQEQGIEFSNPYLDTVAMSRYVNPGLAKHKLDDLVKHYKLGDFNHHRASDDAEMLSRVFGCMVRTLKDQGIPTVGRLDSEMAEHADPKKIKSHHMIILCRNQTGLKNLYKLVSDSNLKYFYRNPRIPRTQLEELREGLVIGSACQAGELYGAILEGKSEEDLKKIASFYDYLEIQPLSNNAFLIGEGKVRDEDELKQINEKIIRLGEELGKPVCATCDVHYRDPEDEIFRRIILMGIKMQDADRHTELYMRTTEEMLAEFSYLGEEKAREVVIENPNRIAAMIGRVRPIPRGNYPPHIDGAEEELTESCYRLAREMYGDPLPEVVGSRLKRELDAIITNGFAIMYIIARKLVENSESKGYQVGSRGSVGSSFVATMAGITRVNPLPPHYRCPKCKWNRFFVAGEYGSGFDLPPMKCPECGAELDRDGHDIPFETFLGFNGDKTPDIDLNFSGDVQGDAHRFTEVLFGKGKAFKAGTIGTLAEKTAFGYVQHYLEEKGISVNRAEVERLVQGCLGVKRTTGQHPGGIIVVPREYDIYDFCPVQHPADAADSDVITTHFEFKYLHDTILKLDILGHDIPTKYKRLEEYSGIKVTDVPMSDPKVYRSFTSTDTIGVTPKQINSETGTLGLPEMGTRFIRGVLMSAKPKNFTDLLQISGLTHGTGCWLGNADDLIKNEICTISDVIGCRDDIMMTLIHKYGMDKSLSFKIMEFVRKNKAGKVIPSDMQESMREHNVPDWYIDSLQKIRYMFPKAHAAAYVIDAIRLMWYKIYYPVAFYAAYFSAAPDGFDGEMVMKGRDNVRNVLDEYGQKHRTNSITKREEEIENAMMLVNECFERGYGFLPVDIKKSDAVKFIPEDGKIRLPLASIAGLGESAARSITDAMESGEIDSKEDLYTKTKISRKTLKLLEDLGALSNLADSSQLSLF
ncbi:MAG: PolC-type DNA polymerase III [Clostridia bacterium]|nr:PolC-type DNA polymerase III [Clostridia bacterium]